MGELFELAFLDAAGRDAGPQLDDVGEVGLLDRGTERLRGEVRRALLQAGNIRAHVRELLVVGVRALGGHVVLFAAQAAELCVNFVVLGHRRVAQSGARARLVEQVDGLVGQVAVVDIPLGEHDGAPRDVVGDAHTVEVFVIALNALDDLGRLCNRRLLDRDGLEAALERGVFLDILAVLGKRRRADDLDFAAGKRGL